MLLNFEYILIASAILLPLLIACQVVLEKRIPKEGTLSQAITYATLVAAFPLFLGAVSHLGKTSKQIQKDTALMMRGGRDRSSEEICTSGYRRYDVEELCEALARERAVVNTP